MSEVEQILRRAFYALRNHILARYGLAGLYTLLRWAMTGALLCYLLLAWRLAFLGGRLQ